jgi:hypothetical protein
MRHVQSDTGIEAIQPRRVVVHAGAFKFANLHYTFKAYSTRSKLTVAANNLFEVPDSALLRRVFGNFKDQTLA